MKVRIFLLLWLVLLTSTANAQPPQYSQSWSVRNLAQAFAAYGRLEQCYVGSMRYVARAELDAYADVVREIAADAKKREPEIDPFLIERDALQFGQSSTRIYDPAPHICDYARVALSQAYWAVRDINKFRAVHSMLGNCINGGECMVYLRWRLDEQGLLAVKGPPPIMPMTPEESLKAQAQQLRQNKQLFSNTYVQVYKYEVEARACKDAGFLPEREQSFVANVAHEIGRQLEVDHPGTLASLSPALSAITPATITRESRLDKLDPGTCSLVPRLARGSYQSVFGKDPTARTDH